MTKDEANVATVVMYGVFCVGALVIYGWSCWMGHRSTRRIQETLTRTVAHVPVPSDEEPADAEV